MNSNSSRAPPPAPLYIPASASTATGYQSPSESAMPRSLPSSFSTPGYISPRDRKESSGSASSGSSSGSWDYSTPPAHHKPRSSSSSDKKPQSPTANVYTYCGRHTDQFLLGGWTGMINGIFKKD
ncbi:hypothetical protein NKR23_g2193 [Pleurostoma richardsiae]|uniref:Uncharacterized protein n=1 Tax=Pleurostoma richardsiae TaxID=41990 RepID=A0AA38S273_9PEZI|nr:hypothetical protein NKR23_g2193 [Pleurostoma richardsiae]